MFPYVNALDYYLHALDRNLAEHDAVTLARKAEGLLGCGFAFYYRLAMQDYDRAELTLQQELLEVEKAKQIAQQYQKITYMLNAYNYCPSLYSFIIGFC